MHNDGAENRRILGRFMLGFDGTSLPEELAELLAHGLSAVAVYPRNFGSLDELVALTSAIRAVAPDPVLIGIDQEGGTKFSLGPPFTAWPSPSDLGRLGDESLVQEIARASARELHAAGVNLNFAPMLDLAYNPDSPVTKGRSFSSDPNETARLGVAAIRGMAAEGILACAKHFPGHGDAAMDPHLDLPVYHGTRERLIANELRPFAAAIDAGVSLMMTAHILLPQLDWDRPASLSPLILDGLLRTKLRFDGLILADDLGMGAISKRYSVGESSVRTLQAGTDIVMLCHNWSAVEPSLDAVNTAFQEGKFDQAAFAQSDSRLASLRRGIHVANSSTSPPLEVIGCSEHRDLASEALSQIAALK